MKRMAESDWANIVLLGSLIVALVGVMVRFPPTYLFGVTKYPTWNPGPYPLAAYVACFILAGVLIWMAGFVTQIQAAEFQNEKASVDDEVARKINEAAAEVRRKEQAEAAALEHRREERMASIELEFAEVKRFVLPENWNATQGTRTIPRRKISEQRTRVVLDDSKGEDALLIVFHYFPDTAYWRYNEFSLFQDQSRQHLDFLSELNDANFRRDVADYDYLLGIGLDSKSVEADPNMAPLRAGFLCASLAGASGKSGKPVVRGLSIGSYDSDRIDTEANQQPYQRPVLILGVKKLKPAVHVEHMIERVMDKVQLKGVDLSLYSGLSGKEPLRWLEMADCKVDKL